MSTLSPVTHPEPSMEPPHIIGVQDIVVGHLDYIA